MTREQMMDEVMRNKGFEVDETLAFCTVCEDDEHYTIDDIKAIYNYLMFRIID